MSLKKILSVDASMFRVEFEFRWAFPRRGPVRVREGVLRSSDSVEVEGARREELLREGYCGQAARLAIGEFPS